METCVRRHHPQYLPHWTLVWHDLTEGVQRRQDRDEVPNNRTLTIEGGTATVRPPTRLKIVAIATGLAIGVAPAATAAVYKRIGSASASGDFAIALASGTAKRPLGVYVSTVATPRQSVSVNWTMVCSKGFGAGSKSGSHTTSSSRKRKLRLPMSNPSSCTVSASGSLEDGGKVTVRLYQR